jgi:hypothetical protein
MTTNVDGLLLGWYSVIRQPGLQSISERYDEYIFFSQQSRKPDV